MHKRDSSTPSYPYQTSLINHIKVTSSNLNKRSQHQRIQSPPSIETVTNGCKKIKLVNSSVEQNRTSVKRQYTMDSNRMECETVAVTPATKRKKITWP